MSWMNQQYQGGYGQPQGYMQPQPTGYMPQMQQPMPMQASRARHLARSARPAALTTRAMVHRHSGQASSPRCPCRCVCSPPPPCALVEAEATLGRPPLRPLDPAR